MPSSRLRNRLLSYFDALLRRFGPRHWWPAETPFEVMVGSILTQNTAWTNVEKAIASLKSRGWLDPGKIAATRLGPLGLAIRSSGYFRQKARRLREYCRWFLRRWNGDIAAMRKVDPAALREELLSLNGIGPETADSILLYALGIPRFVIDAYTRRVLSRHGLAPEDATYDELQALFERHLPRDDRLYNEFHALIVAVGKDFCGTRPRCDDCPLKGFLPRPTPSSFFLHPSSHS